MEVSPLKTAEKKLAKENWWSKFTKRPDFSAIVATIVLVLFFSIFTDAFLTKTNIFGLLRSAGLYIVIAIGMAVVVVVGGLNISIGATGAMCTVVCGVCFQNWGLPIPVTILITLLVGAISGLFNGLIITRVGLNPFVTTLSTMFVYQGIANGVSKGYPYNQIPEEFTWLGRGSVFNVIPYLFILAVIFLVILWVFYKYTVLGRKMLATGGNREAAQMLGVRTENCILIANVASNVFASIGAMLWMSRLGSGSAATGGDWMLIGNAVAFIGGTSLAGGVVAPFGLLCAGIMMAIIKNGLVMIGVNQYFEQTFLGVLILVAVSIEAIRDRAKGKK